MYRSVRTLARLVTTTLVLSLTAAAALVAAGTTAASATTTFTVTGQQQVQGLVGFSYTPAGVPMSRNVLVSTTGAPAYSQVWFGVHDTTDPNVNAWYGGWKQADANGNTQTVVTGIPASACGHVLQVSASYNWSVGAPDQYITDNCGPMIAMSANGYVTGDGFQSGQQVTLTTQAMNLAHVTTATTRYVTTTYTSSGTMYTNTTAYTTTNVSLNYSAYTQVQVVTATAAGQLPSRQMSCSTWTSYSTANGPGYTTTTTTTSGLAYADITIQYAGTTQTVHFSC